MPGVECKVTYTKSELIAELEGYGDIIVLPEIHTWKQLAEDLRYHRCQNCTAYEDRKGCSSCTQEIIHAYDDFYKV